MLKIREIVDAVNQIVIACFPERTVYRDILPEQFQRPSFYITATARQVASQTVYGVDVTQSVLVQCIDDVGDRYEMQTNRLFDVTETLQDAFLTRGMLKAGDRRLTIDTVTISRVLDVADLVITVNYNDTRPQEPETAPIAGAVDVRPANIEKE